MTWNKEKIDEFNNTVERSEAIIVLYNNTAQFYKRVNLVFTIIIIIGNYILGAIGIPTNLFNSSQYVNIVIQALIILLGIVGTIHKYLDLTDKITKYEVLSHRHSRLVVMIKKEMGKENSLKTDFNKFYEQVLEIESELKKDKMEIHGFIYNRYKEKMKEKALSDADLFLKEIKIIDVSISADKMKELEKYASNL